MDRKFPDAWIQTISGNRFWPLEPDFTDVRIDDIAHALSLMCRFGGHCKSFYSVAQHSVLVASLVPQKYRLAALLHDAAEAYMADVLRPIKQSLPELQLFEHKLNCVIADTFGFDYPFHPCIKEADNVMLATEKRDLMASSTHPWAELPAPTAAIIVPWLPDTAKKIFLDEYERLT